MTYGADVLSQWQNGRNYLLVAALTFGCVLSRRSELEGKRMESVSKLSEAEAARATQKAAADARCCLGL